VLDAYHNAPTRQARVRVGNSTEAIGFAGLERLDVVGDWSLQGTAMSGTVKHLSLLKNPMRAEDLEGIEKAMLPALEIIDLGLSTEAPCSVEAQEAFGALCASPLVENKTLRVSGGLPLAEALTWVGSRDGGLDAFYADLTVHDSERVADAIVAYKKAFTKMSTLTLPLGELDEPDIERIRAVVPQLEATEGEPSLFDPARYNLDASLGKEDAAVLSPARWRHRSAPAVYAASSLPKNASRL